MVLSDQSSPRGQELFRSISHVFLWQCYQITVDLLHYGRQVIKFIGNWNWNWTRANFVSSISECSISACTCLRSCTPNACCTQDDDMHLSGYYHAREKGKISICGRTVHKKNDMTVSFSKLKLLFRRKYC